MYRSWRDGYASGSGRVWYTQSPYQAPRRAAKSDVLDKNSNITSYIVVAMVVIVILIAVIVGVTLFLVLGKCVL